MSVWDPPHRSLLVDAYQKLSSSSKCSPKLSMTSPHTNADASLVHGKNSEPPGEEGAERRELGEKPFKEGVSDSIPGSATSNRVHWLQALQQGNNDGARIYASNAIRKKSEALNLLRLSSRIDAVASRVETAVTMRQVTGNMTSVVRGMDKAMEGMNLERVHSATSPVYPQ